MTSIISIQTTIGEYMFKLLSLIIGLSFTVNVNASPKSLEQLPDQATLTLLKEVFIPANTTSVFLASAVCGRNQLMKMDSIFCGCYFEVEASGSERILSVGRKIVIQKSIIQSDYIGYDHRGSRNYLDVHDGVISSIKCSKNDFAYGFPTMDAPISMDAFNLILQGDATLELPEPIRSNVN